MSEQLLINYQKMGEQLGIILTEVLGLQQQEELINQVI
jgi:hypothetical protein